MYMYVSKSTAVSVVYPTKISGSAVFPWRRDDGLYLTNQSPVQFSVPKKIHLKLYK